MGNVEMMGGDPLSELLAPAEIRAVAKSLVVSGLSVADQPDRSDYPRHLAWLSSIPSHMHDCFNG
ncbi:hypothetical protein AB5I41_26120 [Sphingomonas sp. MMS24-JH45]